MNFVRAGLILLLTGFLTQVAAQEQDGGAPAQPDDSNVVEGVLLDANTGDPIEAATVALLSAPDSSMVTGTTSREDGSFQITVVEDGDYFVRISYVGYQSKIFTDVTFGSGNEQIDLGEVNLAEDTAELDEVEVSAERDYMQVEADRTIYNPQNQPVTAGGTGRNVLEEIPSVDVGLDGDISFRGNQGVTIYLNGKPAPMSGQALTSFLEGLSSDDIERVEVIPNPSAAFEPEGTSGIINIVLAEDRGRGWGGSVSAGASTDHDYNGSGNVNYGAGPWNLFSNYSLRYDEDVDREARYRIDRFRNPTTYLDQESREVENDLNHTFNSTVEYQLSERNSLSFRSIFSRRGEETEELTSYSELGPDSVMTDRYERQTLGGRSDFGMDYRFDFERIIDPGEHELDVELRYEQDWEDNQNDYIQRSLSVDTGEPVGGEPEEEQWIDEAETEKEISAEVDYTRPLGDNAGLEAGYRGDFERLNSDFYSESLNLDTGNIAPDTELNNEFVYDEQAHAIFGVVNGSLGSFNGQIGLRTERAFTRFDQRTLEETFDNSYFSFFPSVHFSYKATQSNTFNISYSKRVRRPGSWHMNPFSNYDDPNFRRVGNPELTPEYTHSFEAGYSRLGEHYTVSLTPYFRHTVDEISWHEEINDEGVTILTFENFDTENSYGIELVSSLTLGEWLKANGSLNGFKRVTDATNVQSTLSNNALGYQARLRLTAEITDGLSFQVSQYYRSGHDIPGGRIGARTRSNLALQQSLLNDRASLSLRASDLLGERGFQMQRDTERFYQESTRSRDPRTVRLNFRYNFSQGSSDRGGRGGRGGRRGR